MKFLQSRDDRFFPVEFQRRVVRERLGIVPDEMDGGHLVALSRPKELADHLEAYLDERRTTRNDPWGRTHETQPDAPAVLANERTKGERE